MVANCRGGAVRRAAPGLPSSARVSNRAVRFAEETMMRAFIFPGQGSQAVGMGGALADASPVARAVFEEVDEALGQNLFRLMREGPADDLTLTENAQPRSEEHTSELQSLMRISYAVFCLKQKTPQHQS